MRSKLISLGLLLLIVSYFTYAVDATGIPEIDKPISQGQTILKLIAKWGGIAMIVLAGLMFGQGKLRGQALNYGVSLILGLGLVSAAFGWWDTNFTSGFAA